MPTPTGACGRQLHDVAAAVDGPRAGGCVPTGGALGERPQMVSRPSTSSSWPSPNAATLANSAAGCTSAGPRPGTARPAVRRPARDGGVAAGCRRHGVEVAWSGPACPRPAGCSAPGRSPGSPPAWGPGAGRLLGDVVSGSPRGQPGSAVQRPVGTGPGQPGLAEARPSLPPSFCASACRPGRGNRVGDLVVTSRLLGWKSIEVMKAFFLSADRAGCSGSRRCRPRWRLRV